MRRFIECCCTSAKDVAEAVAGGASRIELCEELNIGGVTPSYELLGAVMSFCPLPVNVLIRPRGGNFIFNDIEFARIIADITMCKELNVNGIVVGALLPDGNVDIDLMKRIIEAAKPLSITFHRAFDCCANPRQALEEIINLHCDRLLTSGKEISAYIGRGLIADLVKQADDRIIIMPGGGVRPSNIDELVKYTNAREFHSSAHTEHGSTDRKIVAQLVGTSAN